MLFCEQQFIFNLLLRRRANQISSKWTWVDLNGLTTDNSYTQVKLHDTGAEGGQDHSNATEAAPHHDDGPAAICIDQYTANGTWKKGKH